MTLLEKLSAIEHEQWIEWSKEISRTEPISDARLNRWKKLWIPYSELPEEMKEHDRKWANKIIDELNIRNFLSKSELRQKVGD